MHKKANLGFINLILKLNLASQVARAFSYQVACSTRLSVSLYDTTFLSGIKFDFALVFEIIQLLYSIAGYLDVHTLYYKGLLPCI